MRPLAWRAGDVLNIPWSGEVPECLSHTPMRVSGWRDLQWVWQVGHSLTSSSMSLFIRGQFTQVLVLCLHFSDPWCPAWMLDRISCRMDVGTTMRSPLVTSPCSTDSSSLMPQYGLNGFGTSWRLSGQPVVTIFCRADRVMSFWVSSCKLPWWELNKADLRVQFDLVWPETGETVCTWSAGHGLLDASASAIVVVGQQWGFLDISFPVAYGLWWMWPSCRRCNSETVHTRIPLPASPLDVRIALLGIREGFAGESYWVSALQQHSTKATGRGIYFDDWIDVWVEVSQDGALHNLWFDVVKSGLVRFRPAEVHACFQQVAQWCKLLWEVRQVWSHVYGDADGLV